MKASTTWLLVGGLVLAGGAAVYSSLKGDDLTPPTPDVSHWLEATPGAPAHSPGAPAAGRLRGTVAEVLQVDRYTYLRLEEGTRAAHALLQRPAICENCPGLGSDVCSAGFYCQSSLSCEPQKGLGEGCQTDTQCLSECCALYCCAGC